MGSLGAVSSRVPEGNVIRDSGNASASRSGEGGCVLGTVNWRLTGYSPANDANTGAEIYIPMLAWLFRVSNMLPFSVIAPSFILRRGRVGVNYYSHLQMGRSVQSGGPHPEARVSPRGCFEPGAFFTWPTPLLPLGFKSGEPPPEARPGAPTPGPSACFAVRH